MPAFLHALDLHPDSAFRGLERHEDAPVGEIRRATRGVLTKLVVVALEREVTFVVVADDLSASDGR